MENRSLGGTAALVPEFAVKDLPLGRTLWLLLSLLLLFVESNGKLPHLFNPSKTATLVPKFPVEDLPLEITAALVPEFAVKDLSLGRTLWSLLLLFIYLFLI